MSCLCSMGNISGLTEQTTEYVVFFLILTSESTDTQCITHKSTAYAWVAVMAAYGREPIKANISTSKLSFKLNPM